MTLSRERCSGTLDSHNSIKGNELADRQANVAIYGDNIDIEMQLELSETNDVVDRYIIIGKWQHNWGKSHRVALQHDTEKCFHKK